MADYVIEVATIVVKSGTERSFESSVAQAAEFFKNAKGCRGLQLQRCIERLDSYRLVVRWDTVEDHTIHFRQSPSFQGWRSLAAPYFASVPMVEHVVTILEAF